MIYRHIARLSRGHVWITDPDMDDAGPECDYIAYSYFPQAAKVCLLNIDFKHAHRCLLNHHGTVDSLELGPAEFRMVDAGE